MSERGIVLVTERNILLTYGKSQPPLSVNLRCRFNQGRNGIKFWHMECIGIYIYKNYRNRDELCAHKYRSLILYIIL
jgi:hypothetical protein